MLPWVKTAQQLRDELELVQGASNEFDHELFLAGEITPVFFGTALGNFGVDHMLDGLVGGRLRRCRVKPTPASLKPQKRSSPVSCLKFRPTWTRNTVTAWRSCVWYPASMRKA